MNPIGFSTGAIAKGEFEEAYKLSGETDATAIELSALRETEMTPLAQFAKSTDLSKYEHVSFHAPSKFNPDAETGIVAKLLCLPSHINIVAHPDCIITPALWAQLGQNLLIENNDPRKPGGQTPGQLGELGEILPKAGFCIDLAHAKAFDETLSNVTEMFKQLGNRIREMHISSGDMYGGHFPLKPEDIVAYRNIRDIIPGNIPIIIESPIGTHLPTIRAEIRKVSEVFK